MKVIVKIRFRSLSANILRAQIWCGERPLDKTNICRLIPLSHTDRPDYRHKRLWSTNKWEFDYAVYAYSITVLCFVNKFRRFFEVGLRKNCPQWTGWLEASRFQRFNGLLAANKKVHYDAEDFHSKPTSLWISQGLKRVSVWNLFAEFKRFQLSSRVHSRDLSASECRKVT